MTMKVTAMASKTAVNPAVVVRGPWPNGAPAEQRVLAVSRVNEAAFDAAVTAFASYRSAWSAEASLAAGAIACWLARRGQRGLYGVPALRADRPWSTVASLLCPPVLSVSCSTLAPRLVFQRYRWAQVALRAPALDLCAHRVWPSPGTWLGAVRREETERTMRDAA